MTVEGLSKSFDNLHLFSDISFEIKRGEHVALIGNNGTGKTTILKIINDIISADAGTVKLGTNVHIGYYDQEHHNLEDSNTLFEEIADAYPDMTNTKIRNTLAAFMFTGDDVFKLVKDLSGGEKGRLSLAKLMLSEANLIILDEPTNHLDMTSKEILENAINNYTGTVFYVSHDRYFLDRTVDRIAAFENGNIVVYEGDYTEYQEKSGRIEADSIDSVDSGSGLHIKKSNEKKKEGREQWLASKNKEKKLKFSYKEQKEFETIDEDIEKLEEKITELEEQISKCATDFIKLNELMQEKEKTEAELSDKMERWVYLNDLAEKIEAQKRENNNENI